MYNKPVKLPMDFNEALTRLARTPKTAIDAAERKAAKRKTKQAEATKGAPRPGRPKTT
jgi:hypothetical protein